MRPACRPFAECRDPSDLADSGLPLAKAGGKGRRAAEHASAPASGKTTDRRPVGPAENVAIALGLIETSRIDAAILDVRLLDEMSYAVAYALRARGIPLMFLTASERGQLPVDLSDEILIEKPFKAPMLIETVRRMARAAMM
jgi:CheY-like chemotaxis protein